MPDDKIIKETTWKDKGLDRYMNRTISTPPQSQGYIGGAKFDARLDEMVINRMFKLKDVRQQPQGNEPGKIYWDGANKKFKLWVDAIGGWVDVVYTSTSTSTTSSSSSSSSTSTTSSSTSTTSTSTTTI